MPKVLMYATEYCPYCRRAEALLKGKGVAHIDKIDLDLEPQLRAEMVRRSGRRTVPQIWIGERYIGGCDELYDLDAQGSLDALLA
jgi:glutaredoxin 3